MYNAPFFRGLLSLLVFSFFLGFKLPAQNCNAPDVKNIEIYTATNSNLNVQVLVRVNILSPKDSVQLRYRKDPSDDWIPLGKIWTFPRIGFNNHEYWYDCIDGGKGGTDYKFQARVYCQNGGWSPWSATKTLSTSCSSRIDAVDLLMPDGSWQWGVPFLSFPERLRFILSEWCCVDLYDGRLSVDGGNTFNINVESTQDEIEFNGLQENKKYHFKFRVKCGNNFSVYSQVANLNTICYTPVFQSNFFIRPLSESSIEASSTKNADRFQFRLRERGQNEWNTSNEKTQNRHTFSALSLGKRYEVQCRVRCGDFLERWTEWSDMTTYEIPFACPVPALADLAANNIDHFAATLVCSSSQHRDGLVQEHVFRYKRKDDNTWTEVRTSNNQTRIRNLLADTPYEIQAKHNCISNTDGFLWSETRAFRTQFYDCGVRDSAVIFRDIGYRSADLVCKAADKYGYWWRYREVGRSQWTESGLVETNRWTANELKPGTEYEVQLRIWCNGNYSSYTGSRFFSTDFCTVPDENLMGVDELSNNTAVLSYSGDIREGLEWQYQKNGNTNWQRVQSNQEGTPIDGLMAGTFYFYRVRLLCESLPETWSEWSATEQFGTPCDADIRRFSQVTTNSVRVHCTAAGALGYYVRYRPSGTTVWRDTGVVISQEFNIWNLMPDTEYEFQVLGTCGAESGIWSLSSYVVTDAPRTSECQEPGTSSLSADPVSFTTAQLNCSVGGMNGYQFRFARQGQMQWNELPNSTQDFAVLSGLMSNTVYFFQARVSCGGTISPWSDSVRFETEDPGAQTLYMNSQCFRPSVNSLFASQIRTTSAVLNCLDRRGGYKYQFRIKLSSGTQWVVLAEQNVAYYAGSGLQENTSYDFQCRIFCNGAYGPYSASRTFRTQGGQICDEPVGAEFLAFEIGEEEATLACLKDALRYEFRYKLQNAASWTTLPAGQDSLVQLEDLMPGQEYVFQVRIQCSGNQASGFSNGRVFRTLDDCPDVSGNMLSATAVGATRVVLNCSGNSYQGFMFRYRKQGSTEWRTTPHGESASVPVDSLTPQTTYEYQVLGFCSETRAGTWSNSGLFTTSIATSLNERYAPLPWTVYPNPAQDILYIEADASLKGGNYAIYDLIGRVHLEGNLNGALTVLSGLRLAPGMYIVRVSQDGRSDTRKLVFNPRL